MNFGVNLLYGMMEDILNANLTGEDILGHSAPEEADRLGNKCVTILYEAVRSTNACHNLQQMTGCA
eukprot:12888605-Prorocentrum_lima.AAC.1